MAFVRAFQSGLWSDTTSSSPWWDGSALYAPDASDDVYSNAFTIHVDTNVTVNSITNSSATSRLWKDGATTTATFGGTFNLLNNSTLAATIASQNSVNTQTVLLSAENSATIVGTVNGGGGTRTVASVINRGTGNLNIVGSILGGTSFQAGGTAVQNAVGGLIVHTGNILGGSGSNARGLDNAVAGTIIVVGNVTAGSGSAAVGVNSASTGSTVIVGNIAASSTTNGFISPNAAAINKISGNMISNANGTAAIFATRYVIDPIPQNGLIRYSNLNQFTTDSLSAFSMPPISSVRAGVSFANGTLFGTCVIPPSAAVLSGVPVDFTVGSAILNIEQLDSSKFFNTLVGDVTASNSIGVRLKNTATLESVGRIIQSFSR